MAGPVADRETDAALEAVRASLRTMLAASRRLRGRETHRPGQLSFAQYGLLFGLAAEEELSARDLARNADLTPATVTQMLDALEASGLVARRRPEHDRRVVLTTLTAAGRAVVEERRAQIEPHWRAALDGFSAEELRILAAGMERIGGFFEEVLQQQP